MTDNYLYIFVKMSIKHTHLFTLFIDIALNFINLFIIITVEAVEILNNLNLNKIIIILFEEIT